MGKNSRNRRINQKIGISDRWQDFGTDRQQREFATLQTSTRSPFVILKDFGGFLIGSVTGVNEFENAHRIHGIFLAVRAHNIRGGALKRSQRDR